MNNKEKLVEVSNLRKYFPISNNKMLKAVDGLTFDIYKGEILGLVGESGCGKSTLGRTLIQLYEPTSGSIVFDGQDITIKKKRKERLKFKKKAQMIFQDPYSSLNPRMNVKEIITAGLNVHKLVDKADIHKYCIDLLETVGLNEQHLQRYPHEFSGGQRQRIGIARAIALNPELIIADEPIAALDVSIQAQIVNLMKDLKQSRNLTMLFIAHDLSMVHYISDRVGVMYLGHLVELTTADMLYQKPLHPYTQALLSAIPIPNPSSENERQQITLEGEVPSPIDPPSGCPFRTRCSSAMDICSQQKPEWRMVEEEHYVACHLFNN